MAAEVPYTVVLAAWKAANPDKDEPNYVTLVKEYEATKEQWKLQSSEGKWLPAPFKPPSAPITGKSGEFTFEGLPCTVKFTSETEGVVTSNGKEYAVRKVGPRTVLLATEKAFAKGAVDKIQAVLDTAEYKLVKLENYKAAADLHAAMPGVDAMIIRSDIVNSEVLNKADKLQIVVRAGAGYDNIDLEACNGKKIVAQNTPGQNANAVAELVFAMMLTSARNNFDGTSGFELVNRKIAFYGFGAVARAVHRLAQVFSMESYAYDPYVKDEDIVKAGATPVKSVEELFSYQYVSLHVPLTDETKASINGALLSKLPKNGTLINTARPEVVHEADLVELVKSRADFCYLSDVAPKNAAEVQEAAGDKFGKRIIFTAKKMGAQTVEANNNAGVAAANQIVSFFEEGVTRFQVNKF
jgi:D-3-phosphoglycerate dehydrogenase